MPLVANFDFFDVITILYFVIGALVAFFHVKRNEMSEGVIDAGRPGRGVLLLLAIIWPVLLFAFMVEPKSKQDTVKDDPVEDNR